MGQQYRGSGLVQCPQSGRSKFIYEGQERTVNGPSLDVL
jgi:hypothetical protein